MIDNEINIVIEKYVRENLSPKQKERDFISTRYQELSTILEGESFQSGSYARFTSITPVNDLDVIWVLPSRFVQKIIRPEDFDPTEIIQDLTRILEDEYKKLDINVRVKPQSHSVGIYFGESDDEFSIDVVPAIPSGIKNEFDDDIYFVPEIQHLSKSKRIQKYSAGDSMKWILSDPKGYIEVVRGLNEKNESFRKVAKLIRAWRKGCKKNRDDFPIKSFHLELIVIELFQNNSEINSCGAIKDIFCNLKNYLSNPKFADRADQSNYVDDYIEDIEEKERKRTEIFIRSAQIFIDMIYQSGSVREIYELLDRLFMGEEFIEAHGILISINPNYIFKIDGWVRKKAGFRCYWLKDKNGKILRERFIDFKIRRNNIPYQIKTKWKVKNHGNEARSEQALRGEIVDDHTKRTPETTKYLGDHYVECYAIVGDACVAKDRVDVRIVERV